MKYYCEFKDGIFEPCEVTKENEIKVAYFGYDTYEDLEKCKEKCLILTARQNNSKEELWKYFNTSD